MLKTGLNLILLFLCAVTWMMFISQITIHPSIIGDVKLWAGLLGTALSLSMWARYVLKSEAATAA